MPELRDGPPWAMEEMILAEPGLVEAILASPAAVEAAESIREGGPVVIVGCGTSEHAALAGAALLPDARARDAFEASLDPQPGGVLIAISHEAGTAATLAAMRAAAANGARTILITARHWDAQYEWWAHEPLARKAGLSDAVISDIREGKRPGAMQPDEAVVYDVVTELLNKRQLSDDTFGKAKQILGEQQVVDLVAVAGFYVMVSAVIIAGRVAIPDGAPAPMPVLVK